MSTCNISNENKSMLLTTFAIIYGILFLLVGIAGFIPALLWNNLLFGVFNVDAFHNVVHLIFGVIALWVSPFKRAAAIYFKIVGVIYVILALLGFWHGSAPIFNLLSNNIPIAWLHLGIGILALILGFCTCCKKCHRD